MVISTSSSPEELYAVCEKHIKWEPISQAYDSLRKHMICWMAIRIRPRSKSTLVTRRTYSALIDGVVVFQPNEVIEQTLAERKKQALTTMAYCLKQSREKRVITSKSRFKVESFEPLATSK